ncbi:glycosyltransferase family 4 protein [Alteraurantiacibacter aquimixticola]|uniref:glycosyltransferase family 4 protein n=1 Tax=Alteraurantiacibacter aquimixticola TaxID=2489173 RepID=UPI00145B360D|nr:glycosyltransferase family 4 protein [Alteraurantiacibacter aquimixticola]
MAIITRRFDILSQTFVRDHVRAFPAEVLALVSTASPPPEFADIPHLMLADPVYDRSSRLRMQLKKRLRLRAFAYPQRLTQQNRAAIESFLRRQDVGTVLVEFGDFAMDVLPAVLAAGARAYVYFHGFDIFILTWTARYESELRKLLQRIDGAIIGSEMMRCRLIELGCDPGKISKIPCGVRIPPIEDMPGQRGGRAVMVSRMIPWKGPDLAIRSFAKALALVPGATLEIIGEGPLEPDLRQLVRDLEIGDNVLFRGGLSHADTLSAIAKSDMLIQHNVSIPKSGVETLGLSVLEAMAYAKPVVVTRHGSFRETVLDGETGFLVDERDVDAMGQKIALLLQDKELARKMGQQGRRSVAERYEMKRANMLLRSLLIGHDPNMEDER